MFGNCLMRALYLWQKLLHHKDIHLLEDQLIIGSITGGTPLAQRASGVSRSMKN